MKKLLLLVIAHILILSSIGLVFADGRDGRPHSKIVLRNRTDTENSRGNVGIIEVRGDTLIFIDQNGDEYAIGGLSGVSSASSGVSVSGITSYEESVWIATTDKTGIVFGDLGIATRGIDLSGGGLSGSGDYFLYNSSNAYWNGNNLLRANTITTFMLNSSSDIRLDITNAGSFLIGNEAAADTFTNGISQSGTTQFFHADVSDGNVAVGDYFHLTDSSTAADEGGYHIVEISGDTIFVSRNFNGSATNVDVIVYKDVIAFHTTDGVLGQQITQHSHQDEPLCIGGEVGECSATGHSLGSTGVIFAPPVEFDNDTYFDNSIHIIDNIQIRWGNSIDVKMLYETEDTDANLFIIELPTGNSINVPVLEIGDVGIKDNDLGWFDGITDPSIALVSSDENYRSRIFTTTDGPNGAFTIALGGTTEFQVGASGVTVTDKALFMGNSGESVFVSAADNKLYYSDSGGVDRALY